MEGKKFFVKDLEKHQTKDVIDSHVNGNLTVIWRDWDSIIPNHPKMVYVSSINPGEVKGPHLHKNRTSYLTCIHGKVVFIIDEGNNKSGHIIIKNSEGNIVSYLGVGQRNKGILTLKDQLGNTKINISSNENGGYFKANDANNKESLYLYNNISEIILSDAL